MTFDWNLVAPAMIEALQHIMIDGVLTPERKNSGPEALPGLSPRQAIRRRQLHRQWAAAAPIAYDASQARHSRHPFFELDSVPAELRLRYEPVFEKTDGRPGRGVRTGYCPVILARLLTADGRFAGLHKIRLSDGRLDIVTFRRLLDRKSTSTVGPRAGTAVQLFAIRADGVLGVAGSVDDAIAATVLTGVPTWAALDGHGMGTFEWPSTARRLVVFPYSSTYIGAAKRLVDRARAGGRPASIVVPPRPHMSWTRMLAESATLPERTA